MAVFPNKLVRNESVPVENLQQAGDLLLELARANISWRDFCPHGNWGRMIDCCARGKDEILSFEEYRGRFSDCAVRVIYVKRDRDSAWIKALVTGEMIASRGHIGSFEVKCLFNAHSSTLTCERTKGAEEVASYFEKSCQRGLRTAREMARLPPITIGAVGLGKDR